APDDQYAPIAQLGYLRLHQPTRRDVRRHLHALARFPAVVLRPRVPLADEAERAHAPGPTLVLRIAGSIGVGDAVEKRAVAMPQDVAAEVGVVVFQEAGGERVRRVEVGAGLIAQLLRSGPGLAEVAGEPGVGEVVVEALVADLSQPHLDEH